MGSDFMDMAKPGLIGKFCRTNAILTFKEYLSHYASIKTRTAGEALIDALVAETKDTDVQKLLTEFLERIAHGDGDLCI